MADIEKVKQGVKACWSLHWYHSCFDCPYKPDRDNDNTCVERLGADALELLKKKQPKNIKDFQYVADLFIGKCPSCGEGLNNEVYPSFCGFCGQRISWKNSKQK